MDPKLAKAIVQASEEVMAGTLDSQFPIDIFQTGSGTSTNMNANEVIANRANVLLGTPLGGKGLVHPNDHVNMGQSSNDVIPTAIHVAALLAVEKDLLPALRELEGSLGRKAKEFDPVIKLGRTHLMDAMPVRLGQVFGGYATQVRTIASQLFQALQRVHKVPPDYLTYLETAAMLHEVGYFVNRHGRHRRFAVHGERPPDPGVRPSQGGQHQARPGGRADRNARPFGVGSLRTAPRPDTPRISQGSWQNAHTARVGCAT